MSDFSDRRFALGSLTGLRTFRVDQYGRLQASQLNVVWQPGENVGRCLANLLTGSGSFSVTMQMLYGGPLFGNALAEPKKPPPPKDHRPGSLGCTCGFYAYFDNGANPYHKTEQLRGIIEGYGVVTVGTRGFRAEKAKISALIIPPKRATALTDKVRANYADVPIFDGRRDALAAFPLTPPSTPTPDSDPDFWTREAL